VEADDHPKAIPNVLLEIGGFKNLTQSCHDNLRGLPVGYNMSERVQKLVDGEGTDPRDQRPELWENGRIVSQ
jgi:hypothetical protein